jgi:hypothetical protein
MDVVTKAKTGPRGVGTCGLRTVDNESPRSRSIRRCGACIYKKGSLAAAEVSRPQLQRDGCRHNRAGAGREWRKSHRPSRRQGNWESALSIKERDMVRWRPNEFLEVAKCRFGQRTGEYSQVRVQIHWPARERRPLRHVCEALGVSASLSKTVKGLKLASSRITNGNGRSCSWTSRCSR